MWWWWWSWWWWWWGGGGGGGGGGSGCGVGDVDGKLQCSFTFIHIVY